MALKASFLCWTGMQCDCLAFLSLTHISRYFLRPNGVFWDGEVHRPFEILTYGDYYELFRIATYDPAKEGNAGYYLEKANGDHSPRMHVIRRNTAAPHITRIHSVKPSNGDIFYLRTILHNMPVKSFIDARTVGGTLHANYQDAAKSLGLFADRDESSLTILEAVSSLKTPRQLRLLFVDLLINDSVEVPRSVWDEFSEDMALDFTLKNRGSVQLGLNDCLQELGGLLDEYGRSLTDYGLPQPVIQNRETMLEIQRWAGDQHSLLERAEANITRFNIGQRMIFELIWSAVEEDRPLRLFIDGKAGTGKTTIINTLCDLLRATGRIILPTATSAFAAQLYPGGRTTHSTFKVRSLYFL